MLLRFGFVWVDLNVYRLRYPKHCLDWFLHWMSGGIWRNTEQNLFEVECCGWSTTLLASVCMCQVVALFSVVFFGLVTSVRATQCVGSMRYNNRSPTDVLFVSGRLVRVTQTVVSACSETAFKCRESSCAPLRTGWCVRKMKPMETEGGGAVKKTHRL